MRPSLFFRLTLLTCILGGFSSTSMAIAAGTAFTWTGNGTANVNSNWNWNDDNNWKTSLHNPALDYPGDSSTADTATCPINTSLSNPSAIFIEIGLTPISPSIASLSFLDNYGVTIDNGSSLTLNGSGISVSNIINITPTIDNFGTLTFSNAASITSTNVQDYLIINNSGKLYFQDTSQASTAKIVNNGGALHVEGMTSGLTIGSLSDLQGTASVSSISLGATHLSLGGLGDNDFIYESISDNGSHNSKLIKVGSGTLTLDGINTYNGGTFVNQGTLVVGDFSDQTASIALSPVQVNPNVSGQGATLSGFGTIGGFSFANSGGATGTVAPGDATHTGKLTVVGTFTTSGANSVYQVNIDSSSVSNLNISGTATLGSNTTTVSITPLVAPSSIPQGSYDILDAAAGVTGTFALMQPSALNGSLDYSNPKRVSYVISGLNFSVLENGTAVYGNQLLALAQAATWFDSQLQDRILGYASDKEGGANTSPSDPTVWAEVTDGSSKLADGSNGFKSDCKHVALGVEKSTCDQLMGIGFIYSDFSADAFVEDESSHVKGGFYQLGGYGSYDQNHWRFGGDLVLGTTADMNTTRTIDMGMKDFTAFGQYHANEISAEAQASYLGWMSNKTTSVQPIIGAQYQWLDRSHFAEHGSTSLELNLNRATYQSARSRLGLALEDNFECGLHPFALAAWEHEFADRAGSVSANLQVMGTPFNTNNNSDISRDIFVTKLGLSVTQQKIMHFTAFYEGRFTNHFHENAAKLQASYNIL